MDRRLFSLADEQLFPDLRGQLGASLDQLERCQKALSDFLEEKRSAMPRFYFIGDEDLLEILGQVTEALHDSYPPADRRDAMICRLKFTLEFPAGIMMPWFWLYFEALGGTTL